MVAVIGAGECEADTAQLAHEVGARLARAGCALVTGGLGGVMEAASRGAAEAGGQVIGILPGPAPEDANRYVGVAIATGIGDARNAVLANTAEGFIAVSGSYGTLSEIAFALKRAKPVVALGSWDVDPQVVNASNPEEAVQRLLESLAAPS